MNQLILVKASQQGVGLLEALVAVALSAIVILGAVYSTSRIFVSQQQTNLQYIVVNELRNKLQTATTAQKKEWCDRDSSPSITLPKATSATSITVVCDSVEIEVVGNTSNPDVDKVFNEPQPIVFELEAPILGGKVTVGEALE